LELSPAVKKIGLITFGCLFLSPWHAGIYAQGTPASACPRPAIGSLVPEPEDLRSKNGVLKVDLTFHNSADPAGPKRFCYTAADGSQSPTLRLHPGDLLILNLKNDLTDPGDGAAAVNRHHANTNSEKNADPCASALMTPTSTNLHFHGLTIPPVCHQDDVLKTSIQTGNPPFEYRIRIPEDQPPGLYWYHPHIHGFTKAQVLGGASGAIVVEGIERANKKVAGLPERVLVIRDQDLLNPNAPPSSTESVVPKVRVDHDGDAVNLGTGTGMPAKDLSLNFVPVPYPDYPPAVIRMKPEETQLWRVVNACAITYLNLQVLFDRKAQLLEIIALDGVPVNHNGISSAPVLRNHLGLPPGGRVEFVVKAPPEGTPAMFVSRTVNTGPGGENDPSRPLAAIITAKDAPEPVSALAASPVPFAQPALPWLGDVMPVRTRKLYFSEKLEDPNDPNNPTAFYITVDGQTPAPFDPSSSMPNITVRQGDVEDWIIENRSNELHAFHIHQTHFLLLKWFGIPVNEPFLRDTVDVPYFDGKTAGYPSVTLRMDFRDPNIAGSFLYHCHLLEHEDNGMMGLVKVEPADPKKSAKAPPASPAKPKTTAQPD
jgi:FtsP/CotA-like multicopper oxidase with cupredoxin domain